MKKLIASVIALIVTTVVIFSAQTVAYFSDKIETNPVITISGTNLAGELIENTVINGAVVSGPVAVRVMPGNTVAKSVAVRNTGSIDMYLRMTVDVEFQLSEEYEDASVDPTLVELMINDDYWYDSDDGYYYYKEAISHGEITEPLFTEVIFSGDMDNTYTNSTITFRIKAYAVQSNGNELSVFEAQGWPDEQ